MSCKAANATYWASWRRTKNAGKLPLGALVPASEAHQLIKVLRAEWLKRCALAQALGRHHDLAKLTHQHMIRLRTLLKVRRLYRLRMREDPQNDATG